ncbi:MAG: hypothetical protein ABII76_26770 [Pseudomonadota bacterium]
MALGFGFGDKSMGARREPLIASSPSPSGSKRLDSMESLVTDLQATMKAILDKMPDK